MTRRRKGREEDSNAVEGNEAGEDFWEDGTFTEVAG